MRRRWNKETVLFLLAAALCFWALAKLGLFLAGEHHHPTVPKVADTLTRGGDRDLSAALEMPSLDHYETRGLRDPFHDPERPTAVYVRRTVEHRLDDATCRSALRIECRMIPEPLRELRVTLPDAARLAQVGGPHVDRLRAPRREGRVLVVPLLPESINREHHQAVVELALAAELPTSDGPWLVPVVVCTGGTSRVVTEHGDLALVVEPGTTLTALPDETAARRGGLIRLPGDTAPNVFAYHFAQPTYRLPVILTHPRKTEPDGLIADKDKHEKTKKRTETETQKTAGKKGGTKTEETVLLPPLGRPRFELTIFLRPEGPPRGPQAVLRERATGALFRGCEGDVIDGGLQIVRIRDNAVIVRDPSGRHFTYHGRFGHP